jgi:hypothetical protein
MSANETRAQIARLIQQRPFERFVINLDNGDRVTVEHPETIAYDPTGASLRFSVLTGGLVIIGNFDSVTSITLSDTGESISS